MNNYPSARIGILGAGGYAGRELLRLLAGHPRARIAWATSESEAGTALDEVVPGARGPALVTDLLPLLDEAAALDGYTAERIEAMRENYAGFIARTHHRDSL